MKSYLLSIASQVYWALGYEAGRAGGRSTCLMTTFLIHRAGAGGRFLGRSPGATIDSPVLLVTLLKATYNWPWEKASGCKQRPTCCRDCPWDLFLLA